MSRPFEVLHTGVLNSRLQHRGVRSSDDATSLVNSKQQYIARPKKSATKSADDDYGLVLAMPVIVATAAPCPNSLGYSQENCWNGAACQDAGRI